MTPRRRWRWRPRPWQEAVGGALLLGLVVVEGWLWLALGGH
jgi:hypothetical protein